VVRPSGRQRRRRLEPQCSWRRRARGATTTRSPPSPPMARAFQPGGWDYQGHSEHVSRWNDGAFALPTPPPLACLARSAGPRPPPVRDRSGHDGTRSVDDRRAARRRTAGAAGHLRGLPHPDRLVEPVPLASGVEHAGDRKLPVLLTRRPRPVFRPRLRPFPPGAARALGARGSPDRGYVVDTLATGLQALVARHPSRRRHSGDRKYGGVRLLARHLRPALTGVPAALQSEDSGLDLALDPRFGENGLVTLLSRAPPRLTILPFRAGSRVMAWPTAG
jgi:hypothetical protein